MYAPKHMVNNQQFISDIWRLIVNSMQPDEIRIWTYIISWNLKLNENILRCTTFSTRSFSVPMQNTKYFCNGHSWRVIGLFFNIGGIQEVHLFSCKGENGKKTIRLNVILLNDFITIYTRKDAWYTQMLSNHYYGFAWWCYL